MTIRSAASNLFVALVAVLVAALTLVASLIRLGVALVVCAVRVLERTPKPPTSLRLVQGGKNVRVATNRHVPIGAAKRLTAALVGMGFRADAVRAFVDGLGARVETEKLETLIKEGLAELAA